MIILPNNKNIILTAEQVQQLTDKTTRSWPTRTVPQGVAALLAFDYEADLESNASSMTEAAEIRTERSRSRGRCAAPSLNGLDIKKKQAIGVLIRGR